MIALLVWLTFGALACGGMSALGLWLGRDAERRLAEEALAGRLSSLYGDAEALRMCLQNYTDPAMLDRLQGEIDGIMVEIINITNSTTGGN
jgi:hypothetical protein